MSLDPNTELMLADAYRETVADAMAQGNGAEVAHREGLTAAAMFLAAMNGMEDQVARATVTELAPRWVQ